MKTHLTVFSIFTLATLVTFTNFSYAQPPDTAWTNHYGGSYGDWGNAIQQLPDGNYIIGGATDSYSYGDRDAWLLKVSQWGDVMWHNHFGGSGYDDAYDVKQTSDGGFILVGTTSTWTSGGNDLYMVKTDNLGNFQWDHNYGGSWNDWGQCVLPISGGYLIVGARRVTSNNKDGWILKTNLFGEFQQERLYGGPAEDELIWMEPTADGNYICVGFTSSYGAGNADVWLMKINSNLDTLWTKTFGGTGNELGFKVRQTTPDNGFIIGGWTSSYGVGLIDYYLIKTNSQGVQQWYNTYGGYGDDWGIDAVQTDSGYCMAGATNSWGSNTDIRVVWTNANGTQLYAQLYGGYYGESGGVLRRTSDGGMMIMGSSQSFTYGSDDLYLIKIKGNLTIDLSPVNPPIVIPPGGGSFNFNATLRNKTTSPVTTQVWLTITGPGGLQFTALGPFTVVLPTNSTLTRLRTMNVPATAPTGPYVCQGSLGTYPWVTVDIDRFNFTKTGLADGWGESSDWFCWGESFPGEEQLNAEKVLPLQFDIMEISPNPFNATTTIHYELPTDGIVSLQVYDTAGRLVASLVNSWQEAGAHEVTFEGSGLPSGLYLVRMQAGKFTTVQKMMLVK